MPKVTRKVATGRLMKGAESDIAQRPPVGAEPSRPPRPSPVEGEGEDAAAVTMQSPPPLWGRVRVGGAAALTMSPTYPAARRRSFAALIGVALAGSAGACAAPPSQRVIRLKPR